MSFLFRSGLSASERCDATRGSLHLRGFMGREVIGDHVDLLASRLVDHDVSQEGDELGRAVARGGLAQHFAGLGVEGHAQRQRSMPIVLSKLYRSAGPGDSGNTGSSRSSA
jgi:hypothetical protein